MRDDIESILSRLAGRAWGDGAARIEEARAPCPDIREGEVCDGLAHYGGDPTERPWPPVIRLCPEPARKEAAERLEAERQRLAGQLARCGGGFAAYRPERHPQGPARTSAQRALSESQKFAQARPPSRNLMLAGPLGLGKTHLLLAVYFEILGAGISAYFVNSTDLRELFRDCGSFDEDRVVEAHRTRDRLVRARVICWDDAGDVEGDGRRRGAFAEGLKYLLDRSEATWMITTNLTYEAAQKHPDIGGKAQSRLMDKATIIRMEGGDQRLPKVGR